MAQIINIDPQKKDDMFYRYKMPAIITKIEGNGNGIKTVFPNIRDVCAKLGRPAEALNKFFGYELGAQSTFLRADDKFLVMGSFTQERIQERVYDFVTRMVLCKQCRNPETDPRVEKNRLLMTCRSCGKDTEIKSERVLNTLVQHYTQVAEADKKAKDEAKKKSSKKEGEKVAEDGAAGPATGAGKPAKIETTAEELKGTNPITDVANLMHQVPKFSSDKIIHSIIEIRTSRNLAESYGIRLAWRGALEGVEGSKFIGTVQQWIPVMKHFGGAENETVLIKEVALSCMGYKLLEKFPMALKMLWEEGVISEAAIFDWLATYKPSKKELTEEVVATLKAKAQPFLDWLKQ